MIRLGQAVPFDRKGRTLDDTNPIQRWSLLGAISRCRLCGYQMQFTRLVGQDDFFLALFLGPDQKPLISEREKGAL